MQTKAAAIKRHAISRRLGKRPFRFMFAEFMFSPFLIALGAQSVRPQPCGPVSMSGAGHLHGKSIAANIRGP
jgi:hypothetical protein